MKVALAADYHVDRIPALHVEPVYISVGPSTTSFNFAAGVLDNGLQLFPGRADACRQVKNSTLKQR